MPDIRGRVVHAGKRPFFRSPGGPGAGAKVDPAPEHTMDPGRTRPRNRSRWAWSAVVVDAALYRHGRRVEAPASLAEIYRQLPGEPGTMAWIGLYRPTEAQLLAAAEQFGLHPLAVEDAIVAHQHPKHSRQGGQEPRTAPAQVGS
jgi:magnesium transporter